MENMRVEHIAIEKVNVENRLRKVFGDIADLMADIKENGLINPILVTEEYELIAGERRYCAMMELGEEKVPVHIMSVKDALHKMRLEFNENSKRKDFVFSEKMRYAEMLEEEYSKLAKQNMSAGGKGRLQVDNLRVDEVVGREVGIGGKDTYRKAKVIWEAWKSHDYPEVAGYIQKLDDEKAKIGGIYTKVKKLLEGKDPNEKKAKANKVEETPSDDRIVILEEQLAKVSEENKSLKEKSNQKAIKFSKDAVPDFLNKVVRKTAATGDNVIDLVAKVRAWCDEVEGMVANNPKESNEIEIGDIMAEL